MHHSGPLLLTFEGSEQGSEGKNCQNGNRGNPCISIYLTLKASSKIAADDTLFLLLSLEENKASYFIKHYFIRKTTKKYLRLTYAAVVIGALRVKSIFQC